MPGTNFWQTLANTVKSVLGSGVLALPHAFVRAGTTTRGIAVVVPLAALSFYTTHALVWSAQQNGCSTVDELYVRVFGRAGRALASGLLVSHQVLVCAAYAAFVLSQAVLVVPLSRVACGGVLCVAVACGCLVRSMRGLAVVSLASLVVLVTALLAIVIEALGSTSREDECDHKASAGDVATLVAVASLMFSGHFECIAIATNMAQPHRYGTVICTAGVIIVALCLAFALAVESGFGCSTTETLVSNLTPATARLVGMSLATTLALSMPLKLFPALECLELWVGASAQPYQALLGSSVAPAGTVGEALTTAPRDPPGERTVGRLLLALALSLVAVACAVVVPHFGFLVALVGAALVGVFGFVVPPLLVLGSDRHGARVRSRGLHIALCAVGLCLTVVCTAMVVVRQFGG